jgi:hypothetical protein
MISVNVADEKSLSGAETALISSMADVTGAGLQPTNGHAVVFAQF